MESDLCLFPESAIPASNLFTLLNSCNDENFFSTALHRNDDLLPRNTTLNETTAIGDDGSHYIGLNGSEVVDASEGSGFIESFTLTMFTSLVPLEDYDAVESIDELPECKAALGAFVDNISTEWSMLAIYSIGIQVCGYQQYV